VKTTNQQGLEIIRKRVISTLHEDIIGDQFWKEHPELGVSLL